MKYLIIVGALYASTAAAMQCSDLWGQHDSRERYENQYMHKRLQELSHDNLDREQYQRFIDQARRTCAKHDAWSVDRSVDKAWQDR